MSSCTAVSEESRSGRRFFPPGLGLNVGDLSVGLIWIWYSICHSTGDVMTAIHRILGPIDFSDHSRRALDHALAIAKWYDSAVTVLHVSPLVPVAAYAPMSGMPPLRWTHSRSATGAHALDRGVRGGQSSLPVEFDIAEGHTAAVILARASEIRKD